MNVNTKVAVPQHMVYDVKVVNTKCMHRIKWNYAEADGFVAVAYPYTMKSFDAAEYIRAELEKKDTIMPSKEEKNGIYLYVWYKVNVSSAGGDGVEVGGMNEFQSPMLVKIFTYTEKDKEITIYTQNDESNMVSLQKTIKCEKQMIEGFLGIIKPRTEVKISQVGKYIPDLLYYTVFDRKVKYPITATMIERGFEVQSIKSDDVNIRIAEKYKAFFKCIIN